MTLPLEESEKSMLTVINGRHNHWKSLMLLELNCIYAQIFFI